MIERSEHSPLTFVELGKNDVGVKTEPHMHGGVLVLETLKQPKNTQEPYYVNDIDPTGEKVFVIVTNAVSARVLLNKVQELVNLLERNSIGGVFELEYAPIESAQVEALRAQYRIAIDQSTNTFKTPIIGNSDES